MVKERRIYCTPEWVTDFLSGWTGALPYDTLPILRNRRTYKASKVAIALKMQSSSRSQ